LARVELGTAAAEDLESGGWEEFRFVLGPRRWMVAVCEHLEDEDRVVIVTVQDGRSSTSATAAR
jgi:hypothetical protein